MLVKTVLNNCQKYKSFVFGKVKFITHNGSKTIEIEIHPRKNSKGICSGCHNPAPLYDKLKHRLFEHIPIWGFKVFFKYRMRRVECEDCGVTVEEVPWAEGKRELTKTYMHYLASWAKSLSWKEVAVKFHTSWEKVFHSVEYIINWGLNYHPQRRWLFKSLLNFILMMSISTGGYRFQNLIFIAYFPILFL